MAGWQQMQLAEAREPELLHDLGRSLLTRPVAHQSDQRAAMIKETLGLEGQGGQQADWAVLPSETGQRDARRAGRWWGAGAPWLEERGRVERQLTGEEQQMRLQPLAQIARRRPLLRRRKLSTRPASIHLAAHPTGKLGRQRGTGQKRADQTWRQRRVDRSHDPGRRIDIPRGLRMQDEQPAG